MRTLWAALILSHLPAIGQPLPRFEVVSIKTCKDDPWKTNPGGNAIPSSPGRIRFDCLTLPTLIRNAYLMYPDGKPWPRSFIGQPAYPEPYWQMQQPINGKEKWIAGDRFIIDAKAEGPATTEMMRGPMLRAILEDRFKLKIHWETREVPVYELTVAKGGAKLQPAKEGACIPQTPDMKPPASREWGKGPTILCGGFHVPLSGQGSGMYSESVTMGDLCFRFGLTLERDVIDKTGLPGRYDIRLELTLADLRLGPMTAAPSDPGAAPAATDPTGAIASALRKVGLLLQPAKGRGQFLVIDHVQRPSGN
ncbi:exported hypothetical protein [Candidatus Sulfopaludibacter sp. SbA3]|nr:exported hypothetical protein [Candidatus Sulfopaludibacter sp. SbA3]